MRVQWVDATGGKRLDRSPVLHHQRSRQGPAGREGEEVVEGFGVVAAGVGTGQGVEAIVRSLC